MFQRIKGLTLLCIAVFLWHAPVQAQEGANYAYFGLEPDIVTNFVNTSGRKLGYVRVGVELMLHNADNLEVAEHHMPLLRATAIEVFGAQTNDKVRTPTGREDIRLVLLKALQTKMQEETGNEMIRDVIFTKFLHHGAR